MESSGAVKKIPVTEPFLPPLEEYVSYLKGIWERNWLTNQGPLVQELEQKLQAYHRLSFPVHCVANGALGLQIALKALGVKGEVITTPFSYVATASCPLWEGCTLRFVDIEREYLTIDPATVEAAITPRTEAILATHVFGNPCDVEALEAIAKKNKLALIYDAAHAFGVTYKGKSILEWGDASMVSLHATKLFHTVEGGFVVAKDPLVSGKLEWMRRFGHKGKDDFYGVGINAKMSELHAAMGLANFKYVDDLLGRRQSLADEYDRALTKMGYGRAGIGDGANLRIEEQGTKIQERKTPSSAIRQLPLRIRPAFTLRPGTEWNGAYYPILFETEKALLAAMKRLERENIFSRRYFHPSLNNVESLAPQRSVNSHLPSPISRGSDLSATTPVSQDVALRILCLPMAFSYDNSICKKACNSLLSST